MDNSYIRKFINSKDICKHLADIDYQFQLRSMPISYGRAGIIRFFKGMRSLSG